MHYGILKILKYKLSFHMGYILQLHCNALWDWFKASTAILDMCVVECSFNTMHYGIGLNHPLIRLILLLRDFEN